MRFPAKFAFAANFRCIALIVLAFPCLVSAATDAPLAVLMVCKGEITISSPSGGSTTGTFGYQLQAGDIVNTGTDSSAEILFEDGNWIAIGAGSSMQIKAPKTTEPRASAPKEKNFEVVQNFIKLKDSGGTSSIAGLRSGGQETEISLDSPCQTRIRNSNVGFHWVASDPDLALCLTIYDENGIFWKTDIDPGVNSIPYPQEAPALEPDITYSWTVETTDPLVFPPLRSQAAFFEVLAADEEKELEQTLQSLAAEQKPSKTSYFLYKASLFFEHNLVEDAIRETKLALDHDPENTVLHSILARLYAESGRNKEALREYDLILDKK